MAAHGWDRRVPRWRRRQLSSWSTARTCAMAQASHQRVGDATAGPKRGHGCLLPAPVVTPTFQRVRIGHLADRARHGRGRHVYNGFLYAGLMIDKAGTPRSSDQGPLCDRKPAGDAASAVEPGAAVERRWPRRGQDRSTPGIRVKHGNSFLALALPGRLAKGAAISPGRRCQTELASVSEAPHWRRASGDSGRP